MKIKGKLFLTINVTYNKVRSFKNIYGKVIWRSPSLLKTSYFTGIFQEVFSLEMVQTYEQLFPRMAASVKIS